MGNDNSDNSNKSIKIYIDMSTKKEQLTDDAPMPYGAHKGTKMANVPADYLIWLYDNGKTSEQVRQYIEENKDVLDIEIERKRRLTK